jgi:hypothetical protein
MNAPRRLTAELLDEKAARFRFVCGSCNHTWTQALKSKITKKPLPPMAVRQLAKIWKGYGTSSGKCPKCSKSESIPTPARKE